MNTQRAVRWSGSGICNGRLRLAKGPPDARYYSLYVRQSGLRSSQLLRQPPDGPRAFKAVQSRSISIFGWGSSSKSGADSFATAYGSPQATPSKEFTGDTASSSGPSIEPIRSIKASHNTSDAADPSTNSIQVDNPNTPEPTFIENIENAIANPSGAPAHMEDPTQIANTPEYIGYLKEVCGLDYGWGMTAMLETAFETMHITGELSWALSIVGIAAITRSLVFIFIYRGADQGSKLREMTPVINPLKEELTNASKAGDQRRVAEISQEMRAIRDEYGFKPSRLFIPVVVQMWVGVSAFRMLRAAAIFPVPAFTTEQWLWNVDLSHSDPYYIVPVAQALTMYMTLRMGSTEAGPMAGGVGQTAKVLLPGFTAVFIAFQPGSVQLYMLASSTLAYLQTVFLQTNFLRMAIGLQPNSTKASSTAAKSLVDGGPLPPKVVGGMTLYRSGSSTPIPVEETKTGDRSVIDRMVDPVKGGWASMKSNANKTAAKSRNKRREQDREEKARKHEYRRREEIQYERDNRNQASQAAARSKESRS